MKKLILGLAYMVAIGLAADLIRRGYFIGADVALIALNFKMLLEL